MSRINGLIGKKFSRLMVIALEPERTSSGKARWLCRCDCGANIVVTGGNLTSGNSESCGCYCRERITDTHRTHGMSKTLEYGIWLTMHQRCTNPEVLHYDRYGGRGVTVCERWRSFEAFYADMGPRPTNRHTIERRDNNKGYEPGNCYWATYIEQGANKSDTILLLDGTPMVTRARAFGLKPSTVAARLRNGWTEERAFSTPTGSPRL